MHPPKSVQDALHYALQTGQSGSQNVTITENAVQLVQLQMPPHMPLPWVVNLFAMSCVPLNGTQDIGLPNQFYLRARVQWGNDKAQEEALIDYPRAGCSFVVNSSLLRVSVEWPKPALAYIGPQVFPTLGGMAVPGIRESSQRPTWLTMPPQTVTFDETGLAAPASFPVPARARGYRVFVANVGNDPLTPMELQPSDICAAQVNAAGDMLQVEIVAGSGAAQVRESLPTSRGQASSLLPGTSVVYVYNTAVVLGRSALVSLQWEMDLS